MRAFIRIAILLALGACSSRGVSVRTQRVDSATAVQLAVAAVRRAEPTDTYSLVVHAFRPDSIGVVIELWPGDPNTRGGGGRVLIAPDGRERVLELFQ